MTDLCPHDDQNRTPTTAATTTAPAHATGDAGTPADQGSRHSTGEAPSEKSGCPGVPGRQPALGALLDHAGIAHIVTDGDGTIVEAHGATGHLLGSPAALVGTGLCGRVAAADCAACEGLLALLRTEVAPVSRMMRLAPAGAPGDDDGGLAAFTAVATRNAVGEVASIGWMVVGDSAAGGRDTGVPHPALQVGLSAARAAEGLVGRLGEAYRRADRRARRYAQELADERDVLDSIMAHTTAMLAYFDRDFVFVRANAAYAAGSGYRVGDLIGKNHFELFPNAENEAIFATVRDTGEPVTYEAKPFVFPGDPDQRVTYWDWSLVPVKNVAGEVRGLVLSLSDVTEQRMAQEAQARYAGRLAMLREIDRAILDALSVDELLANVLPRLRRALGCFGVSVGIVDEAAAEYRVAAFCTADETRIGVTGHWAMTPAPQLAALARGELVVVPDLDNAEAASPLYATLSHVGARAFVAFPVRTSTRLVAVLLALLDAPGTLTEEGQIIGWEVADQLGIAVDHAQLRERVEQHATALEHEVAERTAALRASEARFRAIFEQAAVAIAVSDREGVIQQVNQAGVELLGYSREALRGKRFEALIYPDDLEASASVVARLRWGDVDEGHGEVRLVRRDGGIVWGRVAVSVVREAGESPGFLIAMVEDITAQMQAQDALVRSEKLHLTGQLAATLAHEIGNPLQTVSGCLELIEEVRAEGGAIDRYLAVALAEVQRAHGIVGQLRELNRASSRRDFAPTDLCALIKVVLVLAEREARHRHVEIVWSPTDDGAPVVLAVADRLHQVFLNMVLNALDAMPAGGRLEISAVRTCDPDGARVTFRDSGVGIAEETLGKLFEPFHTTKDHGMGLGLYVCHGIVADHRGHIDVESVPGEGTTFTVWLPETPGNLA